MLTCRVVHTSARLASVGLSARKGYLVDYCDVTEHKSLGMLLFTLFARNLHAQVAKLAWGGEHHRYFAPFYHLFHFTLNVTVCTSGNHWLRLRTFRLFWVYMTFGFPQGFNYTYHYTKTKLGYPTGCSLLR